MKKWTYFYHFMRITVTIGLYFFYRFRITKKYHPIPSDAPVIFAANHQNAIMDAILVIAQTPNDRQPAYMTRSDVFDNPLLRLFFNGVKMIPIYRKRDGGNTQEKNKAIFEKCTNALSRKDCLMIFPEGGQEMAKSLRTPLKKGIAYMALQAAEKMNFEEELYIVPAGVDYESYTKEGKHIYINFGEPIPVSPYYEQYQTNVKVAVKGLTEEVTTALQPLMIDVQKTEVYEEIMALNHIYKPILVNDKTIVGERPADKRFNAEKKLIATLEQAYDQNSEKIAHLGSQAIDYLAKIENLGFKHSHILLMKVMMR